MSSQSQDRLLCLLPLLVCLSGLLASILILPGIKYVVSDDALFYTQIAYDALSIGNASFNGIEATNGFHPLHGFLLIGLKFLLPALSKVEFLKPALLFGFICSCFALLLLYRVMRKISVSKYGAFVGCSLFGFYLFGGMFFTEAAVNALCQLLLLDYLLKEKIKPDRVGILLGLLVLARLDNIFLLPFLLLYLSLVRRFDRAALSWLIIAFSLTVFPYFLWNYLSFGSLMPVSGWAKSTFPHIRSFQVAWSDTTPLSQISLAGLLISGVVWFRAPVRKGAEVVGCFLAAALGNWLYYFLIQKAAHNSWYFVQAILVISIIFPKAIEQFISSFKTASLKKFYSAVCILVAVFSLIALPAYGWLKASTKGRGNLNELIQGHTWGELVFYEVAEASSKALPPGTRVLAFDLPGYLSYFGDLSVTPIDCLTLNVSACKALYSNPLNYLRQHEIGNIVWSFPQGCQDKLDLFAYYSKEYIGTVPLDCSKARLISQPFSIYTVPVFN